MPRNGSGTYSLPAGTLQAPGDLIESDDWNAFCNDVASEITASLPVAGTKAMSADLPMGGNKLTGLGTGSASTDSITFGQVFAGVSEKSADYTVTSSDRGVLVTFDSSAAARTATLPSAATVGEGFWCAIKLVGGAANNVTVDGDGSETIDGETTITLSSDDACIALRSDGTNWQIFASHNYIPASLVTNAMLAVSPIARPQGYLTLVSGTPVVTSDQASKTIVYYTPDKGNLIPLYNGTRYVPTVLSELTLTLVTQHLANTIYDVFVWLESGVVTVGTGPAWSVSTAGSGARGTGAGTTELERVAGLLINKVQMTTRNSSTTYTVAANRATYVGSILIDGTAGQVTCHRSYGQSRQWGVWNAYNRRPIILQVGDSTASWTYAPGSGFRSSNNDSTNQGIVLCGLAEELVRTAFRQRRNTGASQVGIGWNVTSSTTSGIVDQTDNANNFVLQAEYVATPFLGRGEATGLENQVSGTGNYFGGQDDMQMLIEWMG